MAQLNFNARNVTPDTGVMDPIPAGWYNVMVDQTDMKPTNDGQGAYLEARMNVIDGQHKDRKLFARFNIRNNSAQAQEIAFKQLSALCHAVGVLDCMDSQQLHNIPLKIKVTLRPARTDEQTGKTYEASNEVKAFRNINEVVDMAAATAPAGYAQPQQAPQGFAMPPQQPQAPQQAPQGWGAPQPAPQQYAPPQQPAPQAQPWQGAAPGMGAPNVPPAQPQQAQPWAQPQQPAQPPAMPPQQPQQAPSAPIPGTASQPWAQAGNVPPGAQPNGPMQGQQPQPWQGQQPQGAQPPWAR